MGSVRRDLAWFAFYAALVTLDLLAGAHHHPFAVVILGMLGAFWLLTAAADYWSVIALRRLAAQHNRRHPATNVKTHTESWVKVNGRVVRRWVDGVEIDPTIDDETPNAGMTVEQLRKAFERIQRQGRGEPT